MRRSAVVNAGRSKTTTSAGWHFVEHGLQRTAHFPEWPSRRSQAIAWFSARVSARTGFDDTVYQLQIPTDNPAIIERAMLAMEDWAHNVTFPPDEVEKERGVILEEWRLGLGPESRMQETQFPVLFKGSRYAERIPIGNPDVIRSFSIDKLKRFYADWYRPDLMAVMAVGDFDPAAIEALIKAHFTGIPRAANPRPRPTFDIPEHPGTLYAVATDPEATSTSVSVVTNMPFKGQTTLGDYRRQMLERPFGSVLTDRLDEIAQKPDAPFLAARTVRNLFGRSVETTSLDAIVPEGGVERGLAALFAEAERVAQFGFTAGEFDRVRLNLRRFFQRAVTEKESEDSGDLADEYIRAFTQAEPIPGIVGEYGLNERFLPELTLAEINALAKTWIADRSRAVLVGAPRKPGVPVPDEAKLAAVIKAAGGGGSLTAYVDSVDNRPLLDPLPAPGKIVKTTTKESIGITEWQLSNGVRVVLKPTTFKQDEVLVRAVSPGGTSMASDQDFIAAETADNVVSDGGLGRFSRTNLDKVLAGKTAAVRPEISEMFEGLRGGASGRDVETMFQLIYMTFTQPRADPEVFSVFTRQLSQRLANRQAVPEEVFNDAVQSAVTQDHPRARPLGPAAINQMSLEKSLAFYNDRFADASDFTFIFVGSFDLKTMAPLVERYLGSLPTLNRRETGRDLGVRPPTGVVERRVVKGLDPRAEVSVIFTGSFQNDEPHRVLVRAMAESLEGNLQGVLREDLGGTYGVSVTPDFRKAPNSEYRLTINFSCDPARTDVLVRAVFREVDSFRFEGPGGGQLASIRSALLRDFETNSRDNGYLLNQIAFRYQHNEDVEDVFNLPDFANELTTAAVRDAGAYLEHEPLREGDLVPEARAQKARRLRAAILAAALGPRAAASQETTAPPAAAAAASPSAAARDRIAQHQVHARQRRVRRDRASDVSARG